MRAGYTQKRQEKDIKKGFKILENWLNKLDKIIKKERDKK